MEFPLIWHPLYTPFCQIKHKVEITSKDNWTNGFLLQFCHWEIQPKLHKGNLLW